MNFINRIFLGIIFFNFFIFSIFSQNNVVKNIHKNRFLQTKYFDIIYPPQSKKSALLLYEHADSYAEEISALLKTTAPKKRIPVYLIANNQSLNAYFTVIPYSRIVLYDTGFYDSQLSSLKDNILMVFYHELTHAISLNIRSPFWQGMSSVFGDALSPNMIWSMPLSFIEGVTVSFESNRDKQGRLNDPLVHHYFSQNRLEEKSPSWKDASTPKNIFPYGKWPYLYGGAFSRYLQKKYGMEKYAELWHRGGRFGLFDDFTIQQKFKKTYNVSIDYAWQDFLFSLPLPKDIDSKEISTNVKIIDKAKKKEQKLYGTITSCKNNFIWADVEKRAVFMQEQDSSHESNLKKTEKETERKLKKKKLFDTDGFLHRLSCSQDGKLLLVSTMRMIASYPQNIVRVFDVQKKKFLRESYKSFRDADFAYDSPLEKNPRYIVAVRQKNQDSELVLIDRFSSSKKNGKKLHNEKILMSAGPGEPFAALYNPSFAGNKNIAFIAANGMQRKILFLDFSADVISKKTKLQALPLQEIEAVRYLQSSYTAQGWVLTFSFVPSLKNLGENLYRLAKYNVTKKQLSLQQKNIFGGVFSSTVYKNNIYYIAHFADSDAILEFPKDFAVKNIQTVPVAFDLPKASSLAVKDFSVEEKKYRSARWLVDGFFLPYVYIPKNILNYNYLAPAFAYVTADPTERFQLMVLPAVFYVKPFFADITAGFTYSLKPNFAISTVIKDSIPNGFDSKNAYRKSGIGLAFRFVTALDVSWRQFGLLAASGFHRHAPKLHDYKNPYNAPYVDDFTYLDVVTFFSMFQQSRFKRRLFFGEIKRGFQLNLESYTPLNTKTKQAWPLLQAKGDFYFPVLPLRSSLSFAWSKNMQLNSQGYFFKGKQNSYVANISKYVSTLSEYQEAPYAYDSSQMILGFDVELFLLTWSIEKTSPAFALFFHDFFISTGYRFNLLFSTNTTPSKNLWLDSFYVRMSINAALLNGIPLNIAFEYAYPLRQYNGFKSKGKFQVLAKSLF